MPKSNHQKVATSTELVAELCRAQMCLAKLHQELQQSYASIAAQSLNACALMLGPEDHALIFPPVKGRWHRYRARLQAIKWRRLLHESGLFDPTWYASRYPDIQNSKLNAESHFLSFGIHEGRDPGPHFSQIRYALHYKDVLLGRTLPLVHYLQHGRHEDRLKFPPS